jgi:chromosomal replication initiator protein
MLADIKPPRFETRKAILNQKLRDENIRLDSNVVDYIAESVTSNVRQLEGAVNIIAANMRIQNTTPSLENVRNLVKEFLGSASRRLNPASITAVTADVFGVNKEALKGKKRKREILVPRQVAMFLIREMTELPLEEIGDYFERDHSTVVNAIKRVNTLMEQDPSFSRQVEEVKRSLEN